MAFYMRIFLKALLLTILLYGGCKSEDNKNGIKLTVQIDYAYHQKVYLQRVPFNEEKKLLLDSAVVQTGRDTLIFYIPEGNQQRLYNITIDSSDINLPVIADSKDIVLHYNFSTKRYWYKNSPASQSLKNFNDTQIVFAKKMRVLKQRIDSLGARNLPKKLLIDRMNTMNTIFFERYKGFADTVKSPAVFLAVYDLIDFGNNMYALDQFINAAGIRFPNDTTIQKLRSSVISFINAFENRLKIGDSIPELVLPDALGTAFSTRALKGKFFFLDIWSTFCQQCIVDNETTRKVKQQFGDRNFEVVSIAIDDQKEQWYHMIQRNNYNWTQLIDQKMWQGAAFKTLRFDSIPYNILVSPKGKVLAKAIPVDSVMSVIAKFVK